MQGFVKKLTGVACASVLAMAGLTFPASAFAAPRSQVVGNEVNGMRFEVERRDDGGVTLALSNPDGHESKPIVGEVRVWGPSESETDAASTKVRLGVEKGVTSLLSFYGEGEGEKNSADSNVSLTWSDGAGEQSVIVFGGV